MPKDNSPLIYIVHTSFVSVDFLTELFRELVPGGRVRHIVDDSLLPEVLQNGGVTPGVRQRMIEYYRAAESAGADLIFNQCSSVGEVADLAAQIVRTPVIKVDSRMAEVACVMARKIGVIATLETTLGPTCRLVETTARRLKRDIVLERVLVAGAFEKLVAGNRPGHNRMVIEAIRELATRVEVVLCAQGSMVAILPELGKVRVPVLTSPRLGVEAAAAALKLIR
jgi:aspartate/glutamate racemase